MDKEKMQDVKERLDLFPSNMNEPAQKAYCELFDYINNLEQQVQKQKEVIGKAINIINDYLEEGYSTYNENEIEIELIVKLQNILKEVSE